MVRRRQTRHGYVEEFVGARHPRGQQAQGWVYQHILVAEFVLGRRLRPGEEVHHKNHQRNDNRWANLRVCRTRREHAFLHRKSDTKRRGPFQGNQIVECACGCGETLLRFDSRGIERRFLNYHASRLQVGPLKPNKGKGTGYHLSSRTTCPAGHPYDSQNTTYSGGRRYCRACKRSRESQRRSRLK